MASPARQGPPVPPSAVRGKTLFAENCAPCHGDTGLGDGPSASGLPNGVPALADPVLAQPASMQDWFEVTKEGRMDRMMPPWKNRLNDEQIWDVVAYAYSLHVPEASLDQGEAIWQEQCSQCHGQAGAGDGPDALANNWQMPDLSNLDVATGRSDEQWFQAVSNGGGNMPAFAGTLTEDERWAAVHFARTFSYEPARTPALASGDGQLSGRVVNNTAGGSITEGAPVRLFPFESFEERRPLETTVGPDGTFTFDGLPAGSDYANIRTTDYSGLPFGSNVITIPTDTLKVDVTVPVWDTSSTPGDIRVELAQMFVESHQGNLLIGELYRVAQDGDRVYTGSEAAAPGRNAVLKFSVPPEATALVLDGGEIGDRFVRTNDAVIDTQPLYPGRTQILMRYLLPYSGTSADFERDLTYPVDNLSVLVAEGPSVDTDLTEADQQTVQDQLWNNFVGTNLAAGQKISLRLKGLDRAEAAANAAPAGPALTTAVVAYHPPIVAAVALVMGVLAVVVFAAYLWRRQPAPVAAAVLASEPRSAGITAADARQNLLQSIAMLDDRYAAGELDDASYTALRTAEKRRLVQMSGPSATEPGEEAGAPAVADTDLDRPDA
ncbi:MAG: c-type cytochrome [Caldilineales bacterium]